MKSGGNDAETRRSFNDRFMHERWIFNLSSLLGARFKAADIEWVGPELVRQRLNWLESGTALDEAKDRCQWDARYAHEFRPDDQSSDE